MKILKQAELMQIIDAINNNADLDENIFDNDKSVSVRQIYFVVRSIDRNVDRNSPKCKKILRMMVEHSAIIVNRGNNGTKSFDDTDRKAYEADKRKDLIKKLEKIASIDDLMSEEEKSLEDFIETEEEVAEVTAFSQGEQQVPIDENVIPEEGQTSQSGTEDVLDMLKIGPKYDNFVSQGEQTQISSDEIITEVPLEKPTESEAKPGQKKVQGGFREKFRNILGFESDDDQSDEMQQPQVQVQEEQQPIEPVNEVADNPEGQQVQIDEAVIPEAGQTSQSETEDVKTVPLEQTSIDEAEQKRNKAVQVFNSWVSGMISDNEKTESEKVYDILLPGFGCVGHSNIDKQYKEEGEWKILSRFNSVEGLLKAVRVLSPGKTYYEDLKVKLVEKLIEKYSTPEEIRKIIDPRFKIDTEILEMVQERFAQKSNGEMNREDKTGEQESKKENAPEDAVTIATEPNQEVVQEPEQIQENEGQSTDPLLMDAIQNALEAGQASTTLLRRGLRVGYARAVKLIDEMEKMGIVSKHNGVKPRDVLITVEEFNKLKMGQESERTEAQIDRIVIPEAGQTSQSETEDVLDMLKIGPKYDNFVSQGEQTQISSDEIITEVPLEKPTESEAKPGQKKVQGGFREKFRNILGFESDDDQSDEMQQPPLQVQKEQPEEIESKDGNSLEESVQEKLQQLPTEKVEEEPAQKLGEATEIAQDGSDPAHDENDQVKPTVEEPAEIIGKNEILAFINSEEHNYEDKVRFVYKKILEGKIGHLNIESNKEILRDILIQMLTRFDRDGRDYTIRNIAEVYLEPEEIQQIEARAEQLINEIKNKSKEEQALESQLAAERQKAVTE